MATQVLPKKAGGGGVLESHGDTAAVETKETPDTSFNINVSRKACNLETLSFPSLPIPSNPSLNIHGKKGGLMYLEYLLLRSTAHIKCQAGCQIGSKAQRLTEH